MSRAGAWVDDHGAARGAAVGVDFMNEKLDLDGLVAMAAGRRLTPCPDCGGKGILVGGVGDEGEDWEPVVSLCPRCCGSGWVEDGGVS